MKHMSKPRSYFLGGFAIGVASTALQVFSEWTKSGLLPIGLGWVDIAVQALFAGMIVGAIGALIGGWVAKRDARSNRT